MFVHPNTRPGGLRDRKPPDMKHPFDNPREHAAILAGLRLLQDYLSGQEPKPVDDILTNAGAQRAISPKRLEKLIETINENEGTDPNEPSIVIDLSGGLVQDVYARFEGKVLVRDFDTEGADREEIETTAGGSEYVPRSLYASSLQ